jgi:hypothetical protein
MAEIIGKAEISIHSDFCNLQNILKIKDHDAFRIFDEKTQRMVLAGLFNIVSLSCWNKNIHNSIELYLADLGLELGVFIRIVGSDFTNFRLLEARGLWQNGNKMMNDEQLREFLKNKMKNSRKLKTVSVGLGVLSDDALLLKLQSQCVSFRTRFLDISKTGSEVQIIVTYEK